jgi:hypothetical protein
MIACTLSPTELHDRREQLAALPPLSREPIPGGVRLVFAPGAEPRLRALVAAEARCCPFLTLELCGLELRVTGDGAAELFS